MISVAASSPDVVVSADVVQIPHEPHHYKTNPVFHATHPWSMTFIEIYHPGYTHDVQLLSLPAADRSPGEEINGVVQTTSLGGYLTDGSRDGPRVDASWDGLLTSPKYYFHVDIAIPSEEQLGTFIQYPICPTFFDWEFPERLPEEWASYLPQEAVESVPSDLLQNHIFDITAVPVRQGYCRMSGWNGILDCAHIIPKTELSWFIANRMRQYNANQTLRVDAFLNDFRNGLALQPSLRRSWDAWQFTFVPKHSSFVTHVFQTNGPDVLGELYHNAKLDAPEDVSSKFYFARFAWTIFQQLIPWELQQCLLKRRVGSTREMQMQSGFVPKGTSESEPFQNEEEEAIGGNEATPDPTNPPDEAAEMAEDLALRDARFPEMREEVEWAQTTTFQNINWYPGLGAASRKQAKWRAAIAGGEPISTILSDLTFLQSASDEKDVALTADVFEAAVGKSGEGDCSSVEESSSRQALEVIIYAGAKTVDESAPSEGDLADIEDSAIETEKTKK